MHETNVSRQEVLRRMMNLAAGKANDPVKLAYLPENSQPLSGDQITTSGLGDVYPSGLVVGTVDGLFTDPSGINRYAVVTPTIRLDELIEVFIITDFDVVE